MQVDDKDVGERKKEEQEVRERMDSKPRNASDGRTGLDFGPSIDQIIQECL